MPAWFGRKRAYEQERSLSPEQLAEIEFLESVALISGDLRVSHEDLQALLSVPLLGSPVWRGKLAHVMDRVAMAAAEGAELTAPTVRFAKVERLFRAAMLQYGAFTEGFVEAYCRQDERAVMAKQARHDQGNALLLAMSALIRELNGEIPA